MDGTQHINLSNAHFSLRLSADESRSSDILAVPGVPTWLSSASRSPLFAVVSGDRVFTARSQGAIVDQVDTYIHARARRTQIRLSYPADGLAIVHSIVVYDGTAMFETWQTIHNMGTVPIEITRLDSLALELAPGAYDLFSYTSDWGKEFEGVRQPLADGLQLETRCGRSSKDRHPWFALFRADGAILSAAVAWSGNWIFRFDLRENGVVHLSGGLHDWEFAHTLQPGRSIDSVPVVVALGDHNDLNTVSTLYGRVGRQHWYPPTAVSDQLPVEWNHWWSYEDHQIDEQTFRANVDVAATLGIDVCTLDAGWFGPPDSGANWYEYRGDYADVNMARFPTGIRALSDYVHEKGMLFGLWCEIEAVGQRARLAEEHPTFVATRENQRLGYLCFGNPEVQGWALRTLGHLIEAYHLDWIKLDFNLDPEAGCNRTDHGHGADDGLYAHYQGYYHVLERLRAHYTEVVLESCSSGGLRIDLGILRRSMPTFLSDPDWPEHGLQVIWGASTMLAPSAWLHWGWSEWIGAHPRQTFNPRDPQLQSHQLDYYVRIAMLGMFGLSQKLPELPPWVAERYAEHIHLYKTTLRRFIREADFYRLTDQPRRDGKGDRWAAFQYVLPGGAAHLLAVFRLPGGEQERTLRLYGLESTREYSLTWLMSDRREQRRGSELIAHGLRCDDLLLEGSALILVQ